MRTLATHALVILSALALCGCCKSTGSVPANETCIKESKSSSESCIPTLLCVADCAGCTAYCRAKSHAKVKNCVDEFRCVREEYEALGW